MYMGKKVFFFIIMREVCCLFYCPDHLSSCSINTRLIFTYLYKYSYKYFALCIFFLFLINLQMERPGCYSKPSEEKTLQRMSIRRLKNNPVTLNCCLTFYCDGESQKWSKPKIKTIQKDSGFTKGAERTNNMQPSTVQWNKLAQNGKQGDGTLEIWLQNKKKFKKGRSNVFITRSFI